MSTGTADRLRWQRVKALLAEALELDTAARAAFLDGLGREDAALRDELASLLEAADTGDGELDALPPGLALAAVEARTAHAWIGRRLGPWRVLSLIAAGGMGEVWRAERVDGQFEQHVAIKAMHAGLERAGLAARFEAERRILASLDHPNLARILDGGITDDGVPYFVMELVDGEPIDAYCERLALDVPARIRLFRSVCQVVHYAHQQRVVHRDLKVDNILVTHDGVVKLVDFGIAKRLDPAAAERTATAQRMMTLVYSSPEQVRGDAITPASDLYSLGVVLYRLLTRASPYPGATPDSAYELTRAICDTEPAAPSRAVQAPVLRRRLRGDLDAVVMMALRKDPARRYASAEAMSEDLFRHLEGLPVQARRGAWSYRAGRFVLRHRAVVAAAMAANLALVAGIGVASREAWHANRERERAERHFESLHQLAHVFVFDLHDAIQNLPGSTAARKLVVQTALTYLQGLGAEAAGDPALQVEVAAGYRKVGDILGRPYAANLGDPAGALANYERARTLLAGFAPAAADAGREARFQYAATLADEGALLDSLGRYEPADARLREAIATAGELASAPAAGPRDALLLASAWLRLAQLQFYGGRLQAYVESAEAARERVEAILARARDDVEALPLLAMLDDLRGQYLSRRDDEPATLAGSLAAFRSSVELLERLQALEPGRAEVARKLASAYGNLGAALSRAGDVRGSAEALEHAVALLAALCARDPQDMEARGAQALVANNLADARRRLGELDASVQASRDALALLDQLAAGARLDASMRSATGVARDTLAQALAQRAARRADAAAAAADRREACLQWSAAVRILDELAATIGIAPGNLEPAKVRAEMAPHCAVPPAAGA